jgi:IS5 family transposase
MAEVGLVRFAHLAWDVAQATVPRYRTCFSKHQFSQPQLLAILCLMRYEDWTFREAEVRLSEHRELRRALGLASVPDYTTLYRFLRRLHEADLDHALQEVVRRVLERRRRRATVAVDATGLAQGAVSTFFVRRMYHHTQQPLPWRHGLKWLAVVDVQEQLILAQSARQAPWNDCANLPALVAQAHAHTPVGCVLADAEFDSERNHTFIRQQLHAQSIIPAKRGKKTWRIHGVRAQMRADFPHHKDCRRSLIETVFSVAKRKLSCRAPGRCLLTQRLQALLLGLAYNLYRLWHAIFLLRMSTEPTGLINGFG